MHSAAVLLVAGAGAAMATGTFTGQYSPNMALESLFGRQTRLCKPVPRPATCERSCGPGFITCVSFPTCYNPGRGDVCCSNGKYCPKGYYCTDGGCCPDGTPLSQCGATRTLSVIEPGSPATSASEPPVSATPSAPATSYSSEVAAATTTESSAAAEPSGTGPVGQLPDGQPQATGTAAPYTPPASNFSVSATAPPVAIQTAGAPQGVSAGGALQMVLGGFGLWLAL